MISFKNQTVTVIRAPLIAERGDQIRDWDNAVEHQVAGCRMQPQTGAEGTGERRADAVQLRWKLFAPPGADIVEQDRVRRDGIVYEVAEYVQHWPSPTGTLAHTEVVLQRWEG